MPEKKLKSTKPSNDAKNVISEAGKFCLDIAKLVFGGVILTGLMRQDIEYLSLFLVGFGVVLIFAILGFYLLAKSNHK